MLATWSWRGARTLAFVALPAGAEVTARRAARTSPRLIRRWPCGWSAYRAGFLPEERRALEAAGLGELLGWLDERLELGIDSSGWTRCWSPGSRAPCVVLANRRAGGGPAGKRWSYWWPGRPAGHLPGAPPRRARAAVESCCWIDEPYVLAPQLPRRGGVADHRGRVVSVFGWRANPAVLEPLTADGCCAGPRPLVLAAAVRAAGAGVDIGARGRPVSCGGGHRPDAGHLGHGDAPATLHPGAVHLHRGASFVVDELTGRRAPPWCTPRSRTGARRHAAWSTSRCGPGTRRWSGRRRVVDTGAATRGGGGDAAGRVDTGAADRRAGVDTGAMHCRPTRGDRFALVMSR